MQQVSVSDVTMKIASASTEHALSFKEKIEISRLLDRLNVSVVELSPIENERIDSLLVKSVSTAVKQATLAVPVGQKLSGVELTWAALKEAAHPRLQVKAATSPAQMEYFWHKKPAQMLQAVGELVAACKALCADVELIAGDATRAEESFLYDLIRVAVEQGATTVTLCDDEGVLLPEEFAAFLTKVRGEVPEMRNVRMGAMCSDALSMGVAGALAALRCGADEIKTASCVGDAPMLSQCASALAARGDSLGLSCDLRMTEIRRVTSQIEWMCSTGRGQNSPFDSGVRSLSESSAIALSANDERAAVLKAVKQLGYDLSDEDGVKVYEAFRRIAEKKQTVSARELDTIVASAALQVPPAYRLASYVATCGNTISACCHMKLQKNDETLEGVSLGDGPIDAAFLAIEQIVGHHYELDDFQIQAVTEGREAMGESIVRLRSKGKLYSGRGISTDIVGSGIMAYINALNKIVYEEAEA